jgi:hypothetical protein
MLEILTSKAIDDVGSLSMYLCCLRICNEPSPISWGILVEGSLVHTFFLLQATQAVGARSGGGLNRAIPRFPAQMPQHDSFKTVQAKSYPTIRFISGSVFPAFLRSIP